jgi:hypothetical protein
MTDPDHGPDDLDPVPSPNRVFFWLLRRDDQGVGPRGRTRH